MALSQQDSGIRAIWPWRERSRWILWIASACLSYLLHSSFPRLPPNWTRSSALLAAIVALVETAKEYPSASEIQPPRIDSPHSISFSPHIFNPLPTSIPYPFPRAPCPFFHFFPPSPTQTGTS
ncbi:uncharacterized protein VTP21DRAFT_7328 [Calcarisporiella thermophila]|uniref:uncharacterized protein n=1 Tax=Calcarisporiella thermophila TaxID=911321 RepID=UPI003742DAEC